MTQFQRLMVASVFWAAAWTCVVISFFSDAHPWGPWGVYTSTGGVVMMHWIIAEHVAAKAAEDRQSMACDIARAIIAARDVEPLR